MLDGLERYERYPKSGQSWLGAAPNDWNLLRNKTLFNEKTPALAQRRSVA